ncbi:hypothetical protein ACINWC743_1275 [Acinetobacter sp. WC-743]|nr:hypothetical protein ACINWC743_1275 [Acinetobacter sp. WC-743]
MLNLFGLSKMNRQFCMEKYKNYSDTKKIAKLKRTLNLNFYYLFCWKSKE